MEPSLLLIALACLSVILIIGIAILVWRRQTTAADLVRQRDAMAEMEVQLATAREEKVSSDRRLAVADEKLSRLPILERSCQDLNDTLASTQKAKSDLDVEHATFREALSREEGAHKDAKDRLQRSEQAHSEAQTHIANLRDQKGEVDEQLAARAESIIALDKVRADLADRLADATRLTEQMAETIAKQRADLSTLAETLSKERQHADEKLKLLTEAKEQMTTDFRLLAEGALQRNSEIFSKQNIEQIDTTLKPLRDKLADYEKGMQESQKDGLKDRAALAEQIRALSDTSARMSSETVNLTRALKGKSQTQGAWGEMILGSILEKSGLKENEHFTRQESHTGEDGQRLRSDIIVRLPNGDRIVVDSKVSLSAFEAHVNAENDDERAAHLRLHVGSIRNHVKGLSAKQYHAAADSRLEFVIMFIPIEGALSAALNETPDLTSYAVENNVAIATPTTLMIALRTAASIWKVEQRNQNAAEIARLAGGLYDKFVNFSDSLLQVGNRIDQAKTVYDKARAQLSLGRGNLVGQAQQLKALGARTSKAISADLIMEESIDDEQVVPVQ